MHTRQSSRGCLVSELAFDCTANMHSCRWLGGEERLSVARQGRMKRLANQSCHPTPGDRLRAGRTPSARRACAFRSA
jgi:hypothetical protein